jgi:hypothetical protein
MTTDVRRLRRLTTALFLLLAASAAPAAAQFDPPGANDAVGENYHVEFSLGWWDPDPQLTISSESIGIPGTDIDLVDDLGIEQKRLLELRGVLRPGKKHRFRISRTPIRYEAETTITREFVFNGQRYRVGLPVSTEAQFDTWRFGYEYDFFYRSRGFIGVLFDLKYTDVDVELNSPIGLEFARAVAPIPTIGGVGRGYITKNLAINGEVNFFKIPENLDEDYRGQYLDYDFNATYNFTNNVGAMFGLKSIDVFYQVEEDDGDLVFKGWYFGGVVRF